MPVTQMSTPKGGSCPLENLTLYKLTDRTWKVQRKEKVPVRLVVLLEGLDTQTEGHRFDVLAET